ncbi:MAG: 1-deoxy-D-xylulose-5-phosphate reductoisomerase, partial [Propionicimonas sp.]|nr:1-deoxy-D-xylulose-5-phosphate reductoisomerase [Propionicimonas sp.]
MRDVVILGSTGSIGTQAIEVIDARPGQFGVVGLSAGGSSVELLADQVRRLRPRIVAVTDPKAAAALREQVSGVEVWDGPDA